MKKLAGPFTVRRSTNCGGPDETFIDNIYEVEASDVGVRKDHYQGFQHGSWKFQPRDVGRIIIVTSQPNGYQCWYFGTRKPST